MPLEPEPEPEPEPKPKPEPKPEPEPEPEPAEFMGIFNEPGSWDIMLSYTHRNPAAEVAASELYSGMRKRGKTVWQDVEMSTGFYPPEEAMKEGAQNSSCVVAIVTGPHSRPNPAEGDRPEDNAYFRREYCMKELRWAREARVPVMPLILADDGAATKQELLELAPEDMKDLASVDFVSFDRSRPSCVDDILGLLPQASAKEQAACDG